MLLVTRGWLEMKGGSELLGDRLEGGRRHATVAVGPLEISLPATTWRSVIDEAAGGT